MHDPGSLDPWIPFTSLAVSIPADSGPSPMCSQSLTAIRYVSGACCKTGGARRFTVEGLLWSLDPNITLDRLPRPASVNVLTRTWDRWREFASLEVAPGLDLSWILGAEPCAIPVPDAPVARPRPRAVVDLQPPMVAPSVRPGRWQSVQEVEVR